MATSIIVVKSLEGRRLKAEAISLESGGRIQESESRIRKPGARSQEIGG